jgi:hypothetical protein
MQQREGSLSLVTDDTGVTPRDNYHGSNSAIWLYVLSCEPFTESVRESCDPAILRSQEKELGRLKIPNLPQDRKYAEAFKQKN